MMTMKFTKLLPVIIPKGVEFRVLGGYANDGHETCVEVLVAKRPSPEWKLVFVDETPTKDAQDVLARAAGLARGSREEVA